MKNLFAEYEIIVLNHYKQSITNVHLLAYILDPKYLDKHLTKIDNSDIFEWLVEERPMIIPIINLKIKQDVFVKNIYF